LTLFSALTL
jgi:inosine-uridine nucleoside N-ribohydrolase